MSKFISFEGIDGCGKSTQARMLAARFKENNIPHILTREPGGSPLAEQIRELIINEEMSYRTQFFLFQAARNDHVINTIKPALDSGKIVICDRFIDSTKVYQAGIADDLMEIGLREASSWDTTDTEQNDEGFTFLLGTEYIIPDITFLLDMDAEKAMKRIDARGNKNSFDMEPLSYHQNNRLEFLRLAENDPDRFVLINADQPDLQVHENIIYKYYKKLRSMNNV